MTFRPPIQRASAPASVGILPCAPDESKSYRPAPGGGGPSSSGSLARIRWVRISSVSYRGTRRRSTREIPAGSRESTVGTASRMVWGGITLLVLSHSWHRRLGGCWSSVRDPTQGAKPRGLSVWPVTDGSVDMDPLSRRRPWSRSKPPRRRRGGAKDYCSFGWGLPCLGRTDPDPSVLHTSTTPALACDERHTQSACLEKGNTSARPTSPSVGTCP